jgi:hypothetical protein
MADYVDTTEDNGGVHINSGIPNRAFALAAQAIGGPSWERPGAVWYDTLTGGQVGPDTDFAGFAAATVGSAARLFPDDPGVAAHVRSGWEQVGVLTTAPAPAPAETEPDRPLDLVPAAQARRVAVRRTGGFAGIVRTAELDLYGDPAGPQVRELLLATDLTQFGASRPAPDRFVYTVALDEWQLVVPEQDLTPELDQVVRIVLGGSGGLDLG